MSLKLGVLGSTRGSVLQVIIDAIKKDQLDADIKSVISNKRSAYILERASDHDIPSAFISSKNLTREAYDQIISDKFESLGVDLIVLIGYMRIVSDAFVKQWQNRIINVHPSLLPKFPGLMDLDVHQAVIDAHEKESGCTVHVVTEALDGGPILVQKKCEIYPDDTPEKLKSRVQALEGAAMIEAISMGVARFARTDKL